MIAFILKCLFVMTGCVLMASFAQSQHTIEGIGPTTVITRVVSGLGFAGKSLGIITVPEQTYNVTFGGAERSTLFIAAERSIYSVQMATKGHVFPAGRREHSKRDTK